MWMRCALSLIALVFVARCGDDAETDRAAATNRDGAVEAGLDGSTDSGSDASTDGTSGRGGSGGRSSSAGAGGTTTPPMTIDEDGDGYPPPQDCDDNDPKVHPSAPESCNGKDEDCDGASDEAAIDTKTFYRDADKDGYGTSSKMMGCTAPEGYADKPGDCDDGAAEIHPGAEEHCDFSLDEDCDGEIDEDAINARTYFQDSDGDGWGDPSKAIKSCEFQPPPGYVVESELKDCEDGSGTRGPNMPESCNDIDDDCDGKIDEGAADRKDYYLDADFDGAGDPNVKISSCTPPPDPAQTPGVQKYVTNNLDCNDRDPARNPDAPDLPDDDNVDSNCDGMDGERANVVYVGSAACGCSDAQNNGTPTRPACQLDQAVSRFTDRKVFVLSTGVVLTSNDIVRTGIQIHGGYDCTKNWSRSTVKPTVDSASEEITRIRRPINSSRSAALAFNLRLTRAQDRILVDRVLIEGPDADPGMASIGLIVHGGDYSRDVTLHASVVRGGKGGAGANGRAGTLRPCNQTSITSECLYSGCTSPACSGADGAPPESAPNRPAGETARGGYGSASYCSVLSVCGELGGTGVDNGGTGGDGADGLDGTPAAANSDDAWGTLSSGGSWSARSAAAGLDGLHGGGGAQGGEGGMKRLQGCIPSCPDPLLGGRGGPGGAGGCGGGGGTAGQHGGPSIALYSNDATVNLSGGSRLEAGPGGAGGNGGAGAQGTPGQPGLAGDPRDSCQNRNSGAGGGGGRGGRGGHGGGGAGGNGGASMCWAHNSGALHGSVIANDNVPAVCPKGAAGLGGKAGTGGAAVAPAQAGRAGAAGPTELHHAY